MSSQLAIPQQIDTLPLNIAAQGPPASGPAAGTMNAESLSEFAQLIQSLSPQPVNSEAAPKIANATAQPVNSGTPPRTVNATAQPVNRGPSPVVTATPAEHTTKNAALAGPPTKSAAVAVDQPGLKSTEPGSTRLVAACPSQDDTPPSASQPAAVTPGLGTTREVSTQNTADVPIAVETNAPLPPPKQGSTETALPVENKPMWKTSPAKGSDTPIPPAIAIATPVLPLPLPLPPVATRMAASNAPPPQPLVEATPQESSSAPVLTAAPAIEVRIRATEEPKDDSTPVTQAPPQMQAQPQLQPEIPVLARTMSSPIPAEPQVQVPPQSTPAVAVAQPPAAPVAGRTDRPARPPAQFYEATELPSQSRTQSQPLRSVSLEFTPDGASDVRLRLSERAGDVHIELHSTDPALTGRLSEGVHDLATSLVNAGYDAQAWTPGQGREGGHGQPQDEQQKGPREQAADPDQEDFDAAMQEPMKEFV